MTTKKDILKNLRDNEMYKKAIDVASKDDKKTIRNAIDPFADMIYTIKKFTEQIRNDPELRQQLAMELIGDNRVVNNELISSGSKS